MPTGCWLALHAASGIVAGRSTGSLAVMWIHEGLDERGKLHYFEISSLVTRYFTYRYAASIPGVEIVKKPRLWRFGDDEIFCVFRLRGKTIEIWEPYGDNSRFHIGASPPGWCPELELVRDAFASRGVLKFSQHTRFLRAATYLVAISALVFSAYVVAIVCRLMFAS